MVSMIVIRSEPCKVAAIDQVNIMKILITSLALSCLLLVGCSAEQVANRGFSLPKGDLEQGKQVFLEMSCIECHTVAGDDLTGDQWAPQQSKAISVEIGGERTQIQTYGNLVSSVINPSHRIAKGYPSDEVTDPDGESKMRNYNDVMTVAELVDLVTFLKSRYTLKVPITDYPIYLHHG